LLAVLLEAECLDSQSWYENLYSKGLFFALNFIDALIWDRFSLLRQDVSLVASDDASIDYRILRHFLSKPVRSKEATQKHGDLIKLHVPDFGKIPWAGIFELRKDKRIGAFRKHLDRLAVASDQVTSVERATQELWKAVEPITPGVPETVIEGTVSNFPLPLPLNPLSLGASLVAIIRRVVWRRANRWFTFVHKMRSLAAGTTTPSYTPGDPFIGPDINETLEEGYKWLTNHPDNEFVQRHLKNRTIIAKSQEYRLVFLSDGSVDVWGRKPGGIRKQKRVKVQSQEFLKE
jgi:hypothetical protein